MSALNSILDDLASGRINAAEAARRIDHLKTPPAEPTPAEPTPTQDQPEQSQPQQSHPEQGHPEQGHPEQGHPEQGHPEESGGRPQYATHTRESFRVEVNPDDLPDEAEEPGKAEEPVEAPRRPAGSKGVDRVVVRAVGRRVRIVGDRSVATLSAEGPHVLRRTGRTIEVSSDGDVGPSLDGFSIIRPPRSFDDLRTLGLGKELVVRVNPDVVVDAEVTAGSLHCSKVPVLGKIRVTAGGATLEDVVEVNDALVQAGSATVRGGIRQGRSRVKVESGSLSLHLARDANVTIVGEAQLGRIAWPGDHGQVHEFVVGNGSARLDIGVVMGHASVRLAEDEAAEQPER